MMIFCTLFDTNYLDKGLVLYRSLSKTCSYFKIYILAMDEQCEEILNSYRYNNLITIPLKKFIVDNDLEEVCKSRSHGQFCWTCTPYLIDYVISFFDEPICTYIDSDLLFYDDPKCLIDEMNDKTVQIVEHRFNHSMAGRVNHAHSGTYCVEFNTFKHSDSAMELLRWWKEQCKESCSINEKNKRVFGDQYYLEDWGNRSNVSVLQNLGGGVAPWNVAQYALVPEESNAKTTCLLDKKTKKKFKLVFYHFHNIMYYETNRVNIHIYREKPVDESLIQYLYIPYLKELDKAKNELKEKFGVYPLLKYHPGLVGENKKNIFQVLFSIDGLFFPKLYYQTIGRIQRKKDTPKNIIEF